MKRGRHDHLTEAEVAELRRMYARGAGLQEIATRFNMSTRCVQTRTSDMRSGGRRLTGRVLAEIADLGTDARHLARPICLVEGCIAPVSGSVRFCATHEPKAPRGQLLSRLMAGR